MIKKIVVLYLGRLNKTEYEKYGIDVLINNGFEVEVWSVISSKAIKNAQDNKIFVREPIHDWKCYKVKPTLKDLYLSIQKLNNKTDFVLSVFPFPVELNRLAVLYCLLNIFHIRYAVTSLHPSIVPFPLYHERLKLEQYSSGNKQKGDIIIDMIKKISRPFIFNLLYKPIYHFLSTKEVDQPYYKNKNLSKTYIHLLDYDLWLKNKENTYTNDDNYIVFLDLYYPFHQEYVQANVSNPVQNITAYYAELCGLFEFLENKYNTRVVIAAHPRANYEDKPNYFKDRTLIYGKTIELVRNAMFVVTHYTTSLSFVVLYKKPFLFVYNSELAASFERFIFEAYSAFFKKPFINLSEDFTHINLDDHLKVDDNVYSEYKQRFIKMDGTAEKPFFQVVADEIKKLT